MNTTPQWQPIATHPGYSDSVLLRIEYPASSDGTAAAAIAGHWDFRGGRFLTAEGNPLDAIYEDDHRVTHWMPMPSADLDAPFGREPDVEGCTVSRAATPPRIAYLIDPWQQTVAPDSGTDPGHTVGADTLGWTTLWTNPGGDAAVMMLYDDRGRLRNREQAFFRLPSLYRGSFPGRAVLLAVGPLPTGLASLMASPETVRRALVFLGKTEAASPLTQVC